MSKVVFKMTFKHPNKPDTTSKNISHVGYISTRSGVDKTITESDLKKELEKGVEDLSSDDETYIQYIDERPRSHGLFGKDGVEDPQEVQEEVSKVESYVWRAIISLKEEDAKELGYTKKEAWQNMLRANVSEMAEKMNIRPSNLRWVAAVHMEKGHPHAHVMFWEKEPEKTVGIVKPKALDDIRKMYVDNIFADQRLQLLNEKNMMRDLLRDLAKNDISKAAKLVKEVREAGQDIKTFIGITESEGVMPRLYSEEEEFLAEKIKQLGEILPGKGRVALKFMPENIKEEVRTIADYLLEQPEFSASLERSLKVVDESTRLYTSDEQAIKKRQYQYSYIVNNIASNLNKYGVEKEQIISTLKDWTDKNKEAINLSNDDKNKILSELKFEDNNESGDIFNNISINLLGQTDLINVNDIRDIYIKDQFNKRNFVFNELIEKDLVKLENNIYTITNKANLKYEQYENLKKQEKEILGFLQKDLSINELLEDRKIKYMLQENKFNKGFELKKYDATIIKEYFGKNNILNINEFKKELADKFVAESKQKEEYSLVINRVEKLLQNGIVKKSGEDYSFTEEGLSKLENVEKGFIYTSYDANVVSNYILKSGGNLTENQLRKFLSEEYQTKVEIEKQYNYLIKRLENNVKAGYIDKSDVDGIKSYSITEKGNDAREEILDPERFKLKGYLDELNKKGFISIIDGRYSLNEDFKYVMNNEILSNIKNNLYDDSKMQEDNKEFIEKLNKDIDECDISYKGIRDTLKFKDIDDPVAKARENAYRDIRDRICQIILKGAAESQRGNIFYVDQELSEKAVEVIKNLNNQIDLIPEQTKVLTEITVALVKTGHTEEQINKHLSDFIDRENINYSKESLETLVKQIKESGSDSQRISTLSNQKEVEYYLSVLKLSGYKEDEAFKIIRDTIKKDSLELDNKFKQLKEDGILNKDNEKYKLTNKGVEEFLKVKDLDKAEKEILKLLEKDENNIPKAEFKDFIENKEIFSTLRNKDPEELKLGKYDTKVRDEFGEKNSLTFKELEEKIYEKYTDEKANINTDKADIEIELLEKRIEKLTLNGYVKFDKESGVYSFTDEINEYFEYDKEKESYLYTDEAMEKLNIDKMEFTRYDAKVTLGYIDKSEKGLLTVEDLRETLRKEIVNQTAKKYYESFASMLESGQAKEYINISESGDITSTKAGQILGREINKLNKFFYECKGDLTEEKLKEICIRDLGSDEGEKRSAELIVTINKLVANGHIKYDAKTNIYNINHVTNNINRLSYQLYKEGGSINKDNLKEVLEKNIINREAENQLKYLIKRLDNLKHQGYLEGKDKEYSLSIKGIEKREDLNVPQRELLRDKLKYLERLGLIEKVESGEYQATDKYYYYMNNVAKSKEEKIPRESDIISKDIAAIIDRTQDKVDVGKIERTNERIATGKYINNDYENLKEDYEHMRNYCNVKDTLDKTLKNLSTTLLVSGISLEETKEILQQWNIKSNSNINSEKINKLIDEAHEVVKENNLWGQTTVISTKEWKEMFSSLGVDEKDIPKWIFKGENWEAFNKGIGLFTIANDIWKSAWAELEKQRMQSEAQAEYMKKQMVKQQAASQNKSAMIEQIKKNKERGSMYREDELDM